MEKSKIFSLRFQLREVRLKRLIRLYSIGNRRLTHPKYYSIKGIKISKTLLIRTPKLSRRASN